MLDKTTWLQRAILMGLGGLIMFMGFKYGEMQQHELQTLGIAVSLAMIFVAILLLRSDGLEAHTELKNLVNSLGKKLETADAEQAKDSAAIADLKKAAAPPAAPPAPALAKPTKAETLDGLTKAVDALDNAITRLGEIRIEEGVAHTAENATLTTLGGKLVAIGEKITTLVTPLESPTPSAPPAARSKRRP